MGRISQWLSTGGNEVMSAAGARLVKALNYPLDLDKLHARANSTFKIMDDHLANREFLELGYPTIGDIACFPYTALAGEGGISLQPYPNILRWIDRMKRSEEHTSELQSLMRISYAVFCLKQKQTKVSYTHHTNINKKETK